MAEEFVEIILDKETKESKIILDKIKENGFGAVSDEDIEKLILDTPKALKKLVPQYLGEVIDNCAKNKFSKEELVEIAEAEANLDVMRMNLPRGERRDKIKELTDKYLSSPEFIERQEYQFNFFKGYRDSLIHEIRNPKKLDEITAKHLSKYKEDALNISFPNESYNSGYVEAQTDLLKSLDSFLNLSKEIKEINESTKAELPEWIYEVVDKYLKLENDCKAGIENINVEKFAYTISELYFPDKNHKLSKVDTFKLRTYTDGYREGLLLIMNSPKASDVLNKMIYLEKMETMSLEELEKQKGYLVDARKNVLNNNAISRGSLDARIDVIDAKIKDLE